MRRVVSPAATLNGYTPTHQTSKAPALEAQRGRGCAVQVVALARARALTGGSAARAASAAPQARGSAGSLRSRSSWPQPARPSSCLLTEGNTLLSDDELEMLVILRINRTFMQYNELTKDHFKRTILDEEPGDNDSSGEDAE